MKSATAVLASCAALGLANLAEARQMHASIDYARYLQEADGIDDELDAWMTKFKDDAKTNGWLPKVEARSADEEREDHKQRFFMAKELVKDLKKANPDANFSTDSPFSLMTTDEFSQYIKNSYLAGGGRSLRLRADDDASESVNDADNSNEDGNAAAHPYENRDLFDNLWNWRDRSAASELRAGGNNANGGMFPSGSYSFQDLIDWFNQYYRPGNQPVQPIQPVQPNQPTNAPANVPTQRPSSQRPSRPTYTPTSRPVGPVAPVGPVGPVAPENPVTATPAPAQEEAGETGNDGNSVDWSTSKCMPPVQNQGQCGSCWSFATVAAVETGKCLATKASSFVKLSEQNLATCDTRNMGCNGGATSYAMNYLQKNGVCSAADVPYTMGQSGRTGSCNSGCTKIPSGIKSTPRVQGESGLVSTLNTHPVVIAVAAGNNAWKQYAGGVLSSCQTSQVDHAVLAVGYDATAIKIRNSWGANWGEKGYIRMKRGGSGTGTCSMYTDMIHATF